MLSQERKVGEDLLRGMKREKILKKKPEHTSGICYFKEITQDGRSAGKVHFWITSFTRWQGVKMTSARAPRGDEWGQCLGDGLHQAFTQVRMKMLKAASTWGSSQKRYQTLRRLTQMEHKMPLRETTEVQMKPCPAKTHYTKLQMDDRNISRRIQLPSAKSCKTCFPRQFSSAVSTNCRA